MWLLYLIFDDCIYIFFSDHVADMNAKMLALESKISELEALSIQDDASHALVKRKRTISAFHDRRNEKRKGRKKKKKK